MCFQRPKTAFLVENACQPVDTVKAFIFAAAEESFPWQLAWRTEFSTAASDGGPLPKTARPYQKSPGQERVPAISPEEAPPASRREKNGFVAYKEACLLPSPLPQPPHRNCEYIHRFRNIGRCRVVQNRIRCCTAGG